MSRRPAPPRRRAAREAQLALGLGHVEAPVAAPVALEAGVCAAEAAVGPRSRDDTPATWASELEGFPARLLRRLPVPTTIVCRSHDQCWAGSVVLRTARSAPVVDGLPDFVGAELDHITLAAEHDRAQLAAWCARKLPGPWVLSLAVATGQAELGERLVPRGWVLGRVLHRLALRIEEVRLG